MERDGMLTLCEHWRTRRVPMGYLADIYDGRVWKDFGAFFSQPNNLGLILNCDWLQPYDYTEYSVGVIYIVILNLPRKLRFKPENIIIVGIIPGPEEPSLTINSYLKPLVTELLDLWHNGITCKQKTIRAALLCVACDLPAAHKVCGFLGHSSVHCSRCTKKFPYNDLLKKVMHGGFDSVYPIRTQFQHQKAGKEWLAANSQAGREDVEKKTGSRYTELNNLPYFDCVRFKIIDPMHNLYLGTAKHVMKNVWLQDILCKEDTTTIHETVASVLVPRSVGRIPRKILSGFASFSADQWKNWTEIFSLLSLYNVIGAGHLQCWRKFVTMCMLFCKPLISFHDIDRAHDLAFQFGQTFQNLYGEEKVTPNMHLHIHLRDCILDFGPVYAFWLFSFERYNGILGAYHTNQKSIEIQVMRKFLDDMCVKYSASSDPIVQQHSEAFAGIMGSTMQGSSAETISQTHDLPGLPALTVQALLDLPLVPVQQNLLYCTCEVVTCLSSFKIKLFDADDLRYLKQCYSHFVPEIDLEQIPASHERFTSVQLWGEQYGSKGSRLERHSYIQAHWVKNGGYISVTTDMLRFGQVQFYFRQNIPTQNGRKSIIMAFVQWHQQHPSRDALGFPVQVWTNSIHEPYGPANFIPIARIKNQCAVCPLILDEENVLAVIPLARKVYF